MRGLRFLLASNLQLAFIDLDVVELASLIPNQFGKVVRKGTNDDLGYKRFSFKTTEKSGPTKNLSVVKLKQAIC